MKKLKLRATRILIIESRYLEGSEIPRPKLA
jgi:hypothetical protein